MTTIGDEVVAFRRGFMSAAAVEIEVEVLF